MPGLGSADLARSVACGGGTETRAHVSRRKPHRWLPARLQRGKHNSSCSESGFTLVELMYTMVIFALVVMVGVPGLREFTAKNRLASQTNLLNGALHFARTEAITRGVSVTVCKANVTSGCGNGSNNYSNINWEDGWVIFLDEHDDGDFDSGTDEVIRVQNALGGAVTLRGNNNVQNRVTFDKLGSAVNGTLIFCNDSDLSRATALTIYQSGRIRKQPDPSSIPGSCTP